MQVSYFDRLTPGPYASQANRRLIQNVHPFNVVSMYLLRTLIALGIAGVAYAQPTIGSCNVFPINNVWNIPVDKLPVQGNSSALVSTIGAGTHMHADFGSGLWDGGPIGIPFVTVSGSQAKYPVSFDI